LCSSVADLRAVIFDYYETLAEISEPIRERLFDDLARRLGVDLPPGEALRHWRELTTRDWKLRLGGRQRPSLDGPTPHFRTFREVWLERSRQLFQHWGVDTPAEVGADANRDAHAGVALYPDVPPALEALRSRYRLAVLSDADLDFIGANIQRHGLTFEAVVTSEELRTYKPHRSVFHAVCDRLELAPAQALYVGDTPWADIEGARHAGLRAVWINRHNASWPEDIEAQPAAVTTIEELVALLEAP